MKKVDEICEECDWVTTMRPKDIVNIIAQILENNPHLIENELREIMEEDKVKQIMLTEDECATILVGLTEFEDVISSKTATYGVYGKLNKELIEKFRKFCWDFRRGCL